jgi:serine/threonine-protein kinase RsbW
MDLSAKAGPVSPASLEHARFDLPSTLDSVADIERTAEGMAGRLGLDEDTASNIAMVTREAAINACKHGNGFAAHKRVTATLDRTETTLTICIADQGEGLNPETLPDPLDPANLLRSSGRGVFLMRAIMDEVHFRQLQPGTEVTLIKHRHSEGTS